MVLKLKKLNSDPITDDQNISINGYQSEKENHNPNKKAKSNHNKKDDKDVWNSN